MPKKPTYIEVAFGFGNKLRPTDEYKAVQPFGQPQNWTVWGPFDEKQDYRDDYPMFTVRRLLEGGKK